MRGMGVVLSAAALVFAATDVSAQAKPNYAGKWTLIVDASAPPPAAGRGGGRGGRGLGSEATLAQDATTLTVTRTTQNGDVKSVYNLDGSDSKNSVNMGGNPVEQVSKAKWDGNKLVITTTANFNGNAFETTMALSLDANGNLVVESTAPGRGGGAATTTTQTYKKG